MDNKSKLYLPFLILRFFIIYILFIMSCNRGQAQGLSIELAVEWRRMESQLKIPPIKSDTSIVKPILKLVYRNLSEEDIFFRHLYYSGSLYPNIICTTLDNTLLDLAKRAQIHCRFENQFYRVQIDKVWEVIKPSSDFRTEHEPDIINEELYEIYEVLRTQQLLDDLGIKKRLSCFDDSCKDIIDYIESRRLIDERKKPFISIQDVENLYLTESEIYGRYFNEFVFLKRGGTRSFEIDLIGFYLLGGHFEFVINNNFIPAYIMGKNQQKISLPQIVHGYKLYEGAFLSNTACIVIN